MHNNVHDDEDSKSPRTQSHIKCFCHILHGDGLAPLEGKEWNAFAIEYEGKKSSPNALADKCSLSRKPHLVRNTL